MILNIWKEKKEYIYRKKIDITKKKNISLWKTTVQPYRSFEVSDTWIECLDDLDGYEPAMRCVEIAVVHCMHSHVLSRNRDKPPPPQPQRPQRKQSWVLKHPRTSMHHLSPISPHSHPHLPSSSIPSFLSHSTKQDFLLCTPAKVPHIFFLHFKSQPRILHPMP